MPKSRFATRLIESLFQRGLISTFCYLDTSSSTMQEIEKRSSFQHSQESLLIQANTQTVGIGRGSNTWHSPPQGLWFSLSLVLPKTYPSMALYIGYCVHIALLECFPHLSDKLRVKWTNDIIYESSKLGGILIRHSISSSVYYIGIGINTNNSLDSAPQNTKACSLSQLLGFQVDDTYLLTRILHHTQSQVSILETPEIYIDYLNHFLHLKAKKVMIDLAPEVVSGRVLCLAKDGALTIETDEGRQVNIYSGSVRELFT